MATETRTRQGDTVDLIAWRHYGRTAGTTEQLLDANPGLADHGPLLPTGTLVQLPDAAPAPVAPAQPVNLWD